MLFESKDAETRSVEVNTLCLVWANARKNSDSGMMASTILMGSAIDCETAAYRFRFYFGGWWYFSATGVLFTSDKNWTFSLYLLVEGSRLISGKRVCGLAGLYTVSSAPTLSLTTGLALTNAFWRR